MTPIFQSRREREGLRGGAGSLAAELRLLHCVGRRSRGVTACHFSGVINYPGGYGRHVVVSAEQIRPMCRDADGADPRGFAAQLFAHRRDWCLLAVHGRACLNTRATPRGTAEPGG